MFDDATEIASFTTDCGIAGSPPIALELLDDTASDDDWSDEPGGVKPVACIIFLASPNRGKNRSKGEPASAGIAMAALRVLSLGVDENGLVLKKALFLPMIPLVLPRIDSILPLMGAV